MQDSKAPRGGLDHERQVLTALRRSPVTSQPKLIEETQLARGTVVSILDRLEKKKIISTEDTRNGSSSTRGRPAKVVRLEREAGFAASVDFGHQHVRVAVGDLTGHELLLKPQDKEQEIEPSTEVEFDVGADAEESLDTAVDLLEEAIREQGGLDRLVAVTIGFPASVLDQVEGRVLIDDSMPQWRTISPKQELQRRLGWAGVPFFIENAARLGALMELEHGIGRERGQFIYLKWSSSIGGALIINRQLDRGASGIGCKLGHFLPPNWREPAPERCPTCKSKRCLDVLAGGNAIVKRFNADASKKDARSLRDVIQHAQGGGPDATLARETIRDASILVGEALGYVVSSIEPSAIVIGGHFGHDPDNNEPDSYELVAEGIRRGLRRTVPYAPLLDNLSLSTSQWRYGAAQGGVVLALRRRLAEYEPRGKVLAAAQH